VLWGVVGVRLCLVAPGFSAAEDDWCIPALHHMVRRLASKHDVTVLALRYPPCRRAYGFFGARVIPLATGRRTGAHRAAMLVRALVAIGREHLRAPFDAVHGLWADEAGFLATVAGRRLGPRSVVSVMGGELVGLADIGYGVGLSMAGRWLVRRSLAAGDAVTVGSRTLVEAARIVRGERPVELAPLGVDTTLFTPDGERADLDGDPCLLQVASLSPVKNQQLLLDAFARVAADRPGARLHVVGDGPLRRELGARAAALGSGDRVRFHGAVPHHGLPPLYRAADLHVTSSRFESQGMAVLEAAACGTATVGTAVGILPELGRAGAARVSGSNDPDAFAAALIDLIEDRGRLWTLGNDAAAAVGASFTVEGCTRRFERICFPGTVPTPRS
jgi:glycosyltransferase involved in cell wall biosynthesis